MTLFSHDFWVSHETVNLSPFSMLRDPGRICNASKSAVRALHILELLADAGKPLRAVEIAGPMGLSPSSANQLLKTMVDAAYLIFNPGSKRYYPSPRVAALGATSMDEYFGPNAIDSLMRSALRSLGKRINLLAAQGTFMQVVDVAWPSQSAPDIRETFDKSIGLRIPLFGSCVGAAWLSSQDEKTVRAAIRLCRRELGRQAADVDGILERIRRVRAQGYAFGGMSQDDRIRALAIPLPPSSNGIVLVLGTAGSTLEMEQNRGHIALLLKENVRRYLGIGRSGSGDGNAAGTSVPICPPT